MLFNNIIHLSDKNKNLLTRRADCINSVIGYQLLISPKSFMKTPNDKEQKTNDIQD